MNDQKRSITICTYPIVAALVKAEDIVGPNRPWEYKNDVQQAFLDAFFNPCRGEVGNIPEIESVASWSHTDINTFLQKRGFSIQLQQFDPLTFGTASVLDVLVKWLVEGEKTTVTMDGGDEFPGAKIPSEGVTFFSSSHHLNVNGRAEPIACIDTKADEDKVFMTMLDGTQTQIPDGEFGLVKLVEEISASIDHLTGYSKLIYPMVDLDHQVNIGWLINMETPVENAPPAYVSQALQQTIFKMNEKGARAKSAVAMAVTLRCPIPERNYTINRPFLVWISRKGLSKPLFVGYITEDDWKDPGDIEA